jgi:hypothetical protein
VGDYERCAIRFDSGSKVEINSNVNTFAWLILFSMHITDQWAKTYEMVESRP